MSSVFLPTSPVAARLNVQGEELRTLDPAGEWFSHAGSGVDRWWIGSLGNEQRCCLVMFALFCVYVYMYNTM